MYAPVITFPPPHNPFTQSNPPPQRRIYLYLSLCAKNEALVGGVFETYAAASSSAAKGEARGAVVKGVLEGEMDAFVKHVVVVR